MKAEESKDQFFSAKKAKKNQNFNFSTQMYRDKFWNIVSAIEISCLLCLATMIITAEKKIAQKSTVYRQHNLDNPDF